MRNRFFRQVISVLVIFSFIVTMVPQNIFAERNEFSDVDSYKDEIYTLVDLGVIQGFTDNTFRPYTTITRGQGIAMIIREMGVSTEDRKDPGFKDLKKGSRFYNEVATAKELGIIDGKPDGTFGVNEKMTRAQMAKILVNAYDLKLIESNNKSFKDVPTSHWAHSYISILVSNGITLGYDDGTFRPQAQLTRLHFSLFLYRYINEVKEQTAQPGEVITDGENKTVLLEDTILIDEDLESSIDIQEKDEDEYNITFSESVDIQEGDVFVLPATDEFPGGLAVKAEKVTEKNNQIIIETSEPELEEVFYSIEGSSEVEFSPEYFVPEPGVIINENQGNAKLDSKFAISLNIDDIFDESLINVSGALKFSGSLKADMEWGVFSGVDNLDFNVAFEQELELDVAVKMGTEVEMLVGYLNMPTHIPAVTIKVPVYIVVSPEGSISLTTSVTLQEEIGVEYNKKDGVTVYPEDKVDLDAGVSGVKGSGKISLGVKTPTDIAVAGKGILGLNNKAGFSGKLSTILIGENGSFNCWELTKSMYYEGKVHVPILNWESKEDLSIEIELGKELYGNSVKRIEVNPKTVELAPEEKVRLSVKGYDEFLGSDDITEHATFESSRPSVIEVTDNYIKATANAKDGDMSTITATYTQGDQTYRDTVMVTVVDPSESEQGTLVGKVVDATNEEPIEGAVISLYKGKELVQKDETKSDGSYKVDVASDTYTIKVEHDKYIPVTEQVKVTGQNTVTYDVKLNPRLNLGFEQGAGYEQGAYDKLAPYPTHTNWSGQSRFIGPENPLTLKKFYNTGRYGNELHYVVGSDGTIYYSKYTDKLYAIGPDGSKKWDLNIDARSIVIGENGIIYAMDDRALYAIQPSGNIEWTCKPGYYSYAWNSQNIMLGEDGSIYLFDGLWSFYKITPNGEVQWELEIMLGDQIAPILANDGNIYLATSGEVYKINSDTGKYNIIYNFASGTSVYDFKVGADGTFYITINSKSSNSQVGELLAISPNGEEKWRLSVPERLGGFSISKDGTIYVNATGRSTEVESETTGVLYAVTSSGEIKWEREGGGSVGVIKTRRVNSPVIGADGTIYNCGINRGITQYYAFSPKDGSEKWKLPNSSESFHLFLGGDGVLYTTETQNYSVYLSAIKDEE